MKISIHKDIFAYRYKQINIYILYVVYIALRLYDAVDWSCDSECGERGLASPIVESKNYHRAAPLWLVYAFHVSHYLFELWYILIYIDIYSLYNLSISFVK